ncbi:MAG: ATP-binding protein [Bacteroidota bacterium]
MQKGLEKVLELTQHPFAVFSANGTLLFQNNVFASFNEISIERKIMPRTEFLAGILENVKENQSVENVLVCSNHKFYELTLTIDVSDQTIYLVGNEISELKPFEKKIEPIENHLEILVNNSEHSLLMEDENRKIIFTNQKFIDLFGIPATPEQMIGADCSESAEQSKGFFKNPDLFVSRINTLLQNRLINEKEILETVTNKTLERNYYPIFVNHKYRGHLWTYKDITSEIELKKGIEIQRNFFQSILNNIPADIAVFDKNHTYLFVNKYGIKNLELREWIIGKKDEDYALLRNKPKSLVDVRRAYFNEAIETKKICSWEDEIKISDTESVYVLRNFYPMIAENGEIELVIGYGIDITNRKRVEKQIIANLEKEKQLTESKSNFITTVSHEIRTPLSIISLSAEAMEMYCEGLPETLKKKFDGKLVQIESEVERLTNIISEVITIEKIESGAFSISKQTFNFKHFIKTLVERQSNIQEDGRKALLKISGKEELISGDKLKLTIAIDNILSNAFKYSQQMQAPTVVVKLNSKKIQIKISDFGLGIPEVYVRKLYKLFERAENVAHIRGTGIGLFLVKQIIESHEGTIEYTPNPEGGSIFTINLPSK